MIAIFVAFIASFISLKLLLKTPVGKYVVSHSNERSQHQGVLPQFGGLGIVLGITCGWFLLGVDSWWLVLTLALGIALVSFIDDAITLPVWVRLGTQLAMGAVFIQLEYGFGKGLVAFFIMLAVVWMVNLYNFMDGMDGMAGGMAVFGFTTFGLTTLLLSGDAITLKAALVIVAATLGFLWLNIHPSKLIMGDVGATTLGFLAAAFSFYGWREGLWPYWYPAVVFLPFTVDATVTLFRRLFNGENILKGHRKHYYQRLLRMGFSQSKVITYYYIAMTLSALLGFALLRFDAHYFWSLVSLLVGLAGAAMAFVDIRWHAHQQRSNLGNKTQAPNLGRLWQSKNKRSHSVTAHTSHNE